MIVIYWILGLAGVLVCGVLGILLLPVLLGLGIFVVVVGTCAIIYFSFKDEKPSKEKEDDSYII